MGKRKYLTILLVLCICVSATCATKTSDTLSIEGNRAFPPYEFINANGEPDGLNVDLVKEIMKRMKVPYVIRLKKWSEVLTSFKKGEVDLILGMNLSSERMKTYKFGSIHGYVYQVAIFRKGTPPIHTLSQFKNNHKD